MPLPSRSATIRNASSPGKIARVPAHWAAIPVATADLSRHPRRFVDSYHRSRAPGLEKDTPDSRPVQGREAGRIVAIPEVGRLHHRYERRAA
jgi:hypothetical protein